MIKSIGHQKQDKEKTIQRFLARAGIHIYHENGIYQASLHEIGYIATKMDGYQVGVGKTMELAVSNLIDELRRDYLLNL